MHFSIMTVMHMQTREIFNNASVYDWFNYSGLLDATDSNDFDF